MCSPDSFEPPPALPTCHHCAETIECEDDIVHREGEDYCAQCYSDLFGSCEHCGGEFPVNSLNSEDGVAYCDDCLAALFACCGDCEELTAIGDLITIRTSRDGIQELCPSCADSYADCDDCGNSFHSDDLVFTDEGQRCADCAAAEEEASADYVSLRFTAPARQNERTGSARCYGVELETSTCSGYRDFKGSYYFGAKSDASITGMEFISPILWGDAGLSACEDFCRAANRKGFTVDSQCGFHLHLDMRSMSIEQLKSIAYAYWRTSATWSSFFSASRRANSFCGPIEWNASHFAALQSVSDFRRWTEDLSRYMWCNLKSIQKHSTFELRLHSATLDSQKVTNWILANIRFCDAVQDMSMGDIISRFSARSVGGRFEQLSATWNSPDLTAFYAARAIKFNPALRAPALDTNSINPL